MAYNITDFGIHSDLKQCSVDLFENVNGSLNERVNALKQVRNIALENSKNYEKVGFSRSVVILGAGPAGLLRTIQTLLNGNPIRLFEKRSEDTEGRGNVISLVESTISILRYYGVYQYLLENKMISPKPVNGLIMVRLADLELAMKKVLSKIDPNFAIEYNSTVTIDFNAEKLGLIIKNSTSNSNYEIKDIDILVNTEGMKSTSNIAFNVRRKEKLAFIPAVYAVYEDERQTVQNTDTFLKYSGKSISYLAQTIHSHTQFLFSYAISKRYRKQLALSLILKTPKRNSMICLFSDEVNKNFSALEKKVSEKREALKNDPSNKIKLQELNKVENEYNSFASYWVNSAFSYANIIRTAGFIFRESDLYIGAHLSLKKVGLIKIGADFSKFISDESKEGKVPFAKVFNKTAVLLAGDSAYTGDIFSALGCNDAVQSIADFRDFLKKYDDISNFKRFSEKDVKKRVKGITIFYRFRMVDRMKHNHKQSKIVREIIYPGSVPK